MAQNITLLGASYTGVPAVQLPKTGGGTALFADPSGVTALPEDVASGKYFLDSSGILVPGTASGSAWDYRGDECEFVREVYNVEEALADTTFPSWTASTTAKAIKATATAGTFSADFANYEYLLRWKYTFEAQYTSGATLKVMPWKECAELWQVIMKRPNSLANITADNFNGNACLTYFSAPLLVYYNSSGVLTYTFAISYGIYPAVTAATFSNATSNTPTVTIKTPTINARCSTTYFATARKAEIDTDSTYSLKGELYRIKTAGAVRSMYNNLVDIYINGV